MVVTKLFVGVCKTPSSCKFINIGCYWVLVLCVNLDVLDVGASGIADLADFVDLGAPAVLVLLVVSKVSIPV